MSVRIEPLPIVPTNRDPRFRYGTRAIPENFRQSTSSFYNPPQRASRFWPLFFDADENECFDSLSHKEPPTCMRDQDCVPFVNKWCNEGQARDVKFKCHRSLGGFTGHRSLDGFKGKCVYDFDFY